MLDLITFAVRSPALLTTNWRSSCKYSRRVSVIFTRNFDNSRIIFIPLFEIYVKCFGGVKVPMCN